MVTRRLAALCTALLGAAACSEPVAPRVSEVVQSASIVAPHRVVGAGHVEQSAGLREFTFHALETPGGGAEGSFKIVLPNGLFFEADVTCVSVDGNTGWVAGAISATNAAAIVVGSVSTFYVIDNGEGDDAGDVVSLATFNGAAGADAAFCADRPLVLPPLTITGGNVQVQ